MSEVPPDDLGWLDVPEETEEERAERRARRAERRRRRRRRRRLKRIGIGFGAVVLVLLVGTVLWFRWTFGPLERMPAVAGQAGADTPGETYLLLGATATRGEGAWSSTFADPALVMVLHVSADHRRLHVISIPATALIPSAGGEATVADTFAASGAQGVVGGVESWTGARIDRVATLDLNVLRAYAAEFDGVVVTVPRATCGLDQRTYTFDGQALVDYVALTDCLPRGDLDRVERQQSVFRALMRTALDGGLVTHPFKVNRLLRTTASHVTVEDGYSALSIVRTLWSMRGLRTTNTTFLTVPLAASAAGGALRVDAESAEALWQALRADRLREYVDLRDDAAVLP